MDIFGQLGINTTAAYQFVIYSITLLFLSKVVFGPYAQALNERQKRTKGGEDLAVEFHAKATELQSEYETKTRDLAGQIKSIVDTQKSMASKESELIIARAKEESEQQIQKNRDVVTAAVKTAESELKNQTSAVATTITAKLLS